MLAMPMSVIAITAVENRTRPIALGTGFTTVFAYSQFAPREPLLLVARYRRDCQQPPRFARGIFTVDIKIPPPPPPPPALAMKKTPLRRPLIPRPVSPACVAHRVAWYSESRDGKMKPILSR